MTFLRPSLRRRCGVTATLITAASLAVPAVVPPISLAGIHSARTPSAVPSRHTPAVHNGAVRSVTQVGSAIVLGGTFTRISSSGSSTVLTRSRVAAFSAATGHVLARFAPVFNGPVMAVESAGDGASVFVGGDFTRVNGRRASHLVRLNLATGKVSPGFHSPHIDGVVNALAMSRGVLYVAGFFSTVGGRAHRGLAAVKARSGAVKRSISVQFTGEHGVSQAKTAGRIGLEDLAVSPDGRHLVAIGNFMKADRLARPQIAVLRLGSHPAVSTSWATKDFRPQCGKKYSTYMRGVDFSPSGSFFVIAATGGRSHGVTLCDSASRWNTAEVGHHLHPAWVDKTGDDTLLSVDVTTSAVYVGGHQRWLNNPFGVDDARAGAVPRPGVAALDTVSGLPLAWNPGRNPRGYGAGALLATTRGLYVGSDTDWIGNLRYRREKIAFFPLASGHRLPKTGVAGLPGTVYELSPRASSDPSRVNKIRFTGKRTRSVTRARAAGAGSWGGVRGAVVISHTVFYGWKNGRLYRRSFHGNRVGRAVAIDPYHDPAWASVPSGSDSETYNGRFPTFYKRIPSTTGMFYWHGRLYYAGTRSRSLHWCSFTVDSGVVGALQHRARSSIDFSHTLGLFRAGNRVYFTNAKTGRLLSIRFSGGRLVGKATRLPASGHRGFSWASRGLVVYNG